MSLQRTINSRHQVLVRPVAVAQRVTTVSKRLRSLRENVKWKLMKLMHGMWMRCAVSLKVLRFALNTWRWVEALSRYNKNHPIISHWQPRLASDFTCFSIDIFQSRGSHITVTLMSFLKKQSWSKIQSTEYFQQFISLRKLLAQKLRYLTWKEENRENSFNFHLLSSHSDQALINYWALKRVNKIR